MWGTLNYALADIQVMAGESQENLTVSLPPELESWLDQHAAQRDIDQETVLVQLLASYRELADGDGDPLADPDTIEPAVRSIVADRLPDIAEALAEELDQDGAETRERIEALEADFQAKLDDVRQRVVQVKREADAKAPADHTHEQLETVFDRLDAVESRLERVDGELDRIEEIEATLERVDEIGTELDGVESQLAEIRVELDDTPSEGEVSQLAADLSDAQERLRTVAWVVRDLRDSGSGTTVEKIKRDAAEQDVRRARCENCGEGVEIGLLTEPSCPHCSAAIDGFEPSSRILGLGSAKLTTASGIGSGADETGDEVDAIDTKSETR